MPFPTSFFIPESPTLLEEEAGESTKHRENSFHLQIQIRMNSKHSRVNSVFSHFVYLQASKEKRGFYSEGSRKLCVYWGKGGISNVFPDHFLRSCGPTLTYQLPCWVVRALSDACSWLWLSASSLITHQFSEPHMSTSENRQFLLWRWKGGRLERAHCKDLPHIFCSIRSALKVLHRRKLHFNAHNHVNTPQVLVTWKQKK